MWKIKGNYYPCHFLRCVKFWHLHLKQDQLIEWMTKGQVMALRIYILWYKRFVLRQQLTSLWERNWTHMPSTSGSYGRLADEICLYFKIFKILYRFHKLLGFLLSLITEQCYYSVRNAFQSAFLKQSLFLRYVLSHEIFGYHFYVNPCC